MRKEPKTLFEFYFGIGLGITKVDKVWLVILPFILILIDVEEE